VGFEEEPVNAPSGVQEEGAADDLLDPEFAALFAEESDEEDLAAQVGEQAVTALDAIADAILGLGDASAPADPGAADEEQQGPPDQDDDDGIEEPFVFPEVSVDPLANQKVPVGRCHKIVPGGLLLAFVCAQSIAIPMSSYLPSANKHFQPNLHV
jgi:hypothetical protein